MQNSSGIYKISTDSGFYIGSTVNFRKRKTSHFCELRKGKHANSILQNAFNKYEGNLSFEIIEYCSREKLLEREQYYLDKYNPRYNICKFAGTMKGYKFTDEQKEKIKSRPRQYNGKLISIQMLKNLSPEERRNRSIYARSCWSEESKAKQIKSLTGKIMPQSVRDKISSSLKGKICSPETKRKIAQQKGWKHSSCSREKMSLAKTGKVGERCPNSKKIKCSNGMVFNGSYEAQRWLRENGYPKAHAGRISAVCRGQRNKTYNMTWEYIDEP